MKQKVYKVVVDCGTRSGVYRSLGELFSNRSYPRSDKWLLDYHIGRTTYPEIEGSLLFAFALRVNVLQYDHLSNRDVRVLLCEADVVCPIHRTVVDFNYDYLIKYWNRFDPYDAETHGYSGSYAPVGTVLCKSITPVAMIGEITEDNIFPQKRDNML